VETARQRGFVLTGCNNVFLDVPDLAVLYGCNFAWWCEYWGLVHKHPAEKWSSNWDAHQMFGINWISEKNAPGLSTDPTVIHHGHGSGFSLVNLVYLMGAERIVLLGYDLRYSSDYDGRSCKIGSGPRHYFGEYPEGLRHWPSVHVRGGVHTELCELYRSVADQDLIEVINCTPDSALDCFQRMSIESV